MLVAKKTVNEREAREAFHTLLLLRLRERIAFSQWRIKGGVNLRFFFKSVRYSEDMDLDAEPRARLALRSTIQDFLKDKKARQRLAELGIRDVLSGEHPAKDTETTLRFKLRLEIGGGVQLPTKVEVSFRDRVRDDFVEEENADPKIVAPYLNRVELPLALPHYDRTAAVRQKISALAGRAEVQARDVFDLAVLCESGKDFDLARIRKNLAHATLEAARNRAFELDNEAYISQVLEFLDEPDRATHADRWEEYQLIAAMLIESVLDTNGKS
jgi:predicted nucleotidyltransferase component of viral defense system